MTARDSVAALRLARALRDARRNARTPLERLAAARAAIALLDALDRPSRLRRAMEHGRAVLARLAAPEAG